MCPGFASFFGGVDLQDTILPQHIDSRHGTENAYNTTAKAPLEDSEGIPGISLRHIMFAYVRLDVGTELERNENNRRLELCG